MLKVKLGRQYPRDVQRLRESGRDTAELARLVDLLMREKPLPPALSSRLQCTQLIYNVLQKLTPAKQRGIKLRK